MCDVKVARSEREAVLSKDSFSLSSRNRVTDSAYGGSK